MSKKEKTDMFLLTPLYFNLPNVNESIEGSYTISISPKEIEKFDSQEDFFEFLMANYEDLFFVKDSEESEARYAFYFNKKEEFEMTKED